MKLTPALTALMAAGVGLIVANLYYIQPLMGDIARQFRVPDSQIGYAVTLCQAGLALGTLTLLPLGDTTDRRRLIMLSCFGAGLALLLMAMAPNAPLFLAANFLLGVTTVATHLQVSYAAHLAPPEQRGRAVGAVMSGLLIGVLSARVISGYIGGYFGWRAMISLAAIITFALGALLRLRLPRDDESHSITYGRLLGSMPRLFTGNRDLRDAAIYGALTFAVFNAFWATFTFYMESPVFGFNSHQVGLLSLVAIAGALAANLAGRLTTRVQPISIIVASLFLTLASFGVFYSGGATLAGIIIGVILMDLGIQATHIGNQTLVHRLDATARSRVHCIYMVFYFLGGALGSALGNFAYARLGWPGLCITGGLLTLAALLYWAGCRVLRRPSAA